MNATELGLVLASALLHAVWSAAIRAARSPLAFGTVQHLLAVPLAVLALFAFDLGDLPRTAWWCLAGTGLAHGVYTYWMSQAYARAELSRVYPIVRSTPALLPLVAVPLGEPVTGWGALGIAIVVAGVWAVVGARVERRALLAPELVYAWLTLASTVVYSLCDKRAMAELGAARWHGPLPAVLAWYALIFLASSPVLLPLSLRAVGAKELWGALRGEAPRAGAVLVTGIAGYGLILQAFRTAPASYVVAVRQLSVLFATGIAMRFLGERPSRRRLIGAAATVIGVALIAVGG